MQLPYYQKNPAKSETTWQELFFSLSMADLGGIYAMVGGETFAEGPDGIREVTDHWNEDDWFTARLLITRKAIRVILKGSNPEHLGK